MPTVLKSNEVARNEVNDMSGNGEAEEREEDELVQSDRGIYQFLLFLLTQLGYLAVCPSMLSTTFFEPSQNFCTDSVMQNNSSMVDGRQSKAFWSTSNRNFSSVGVEFHSLLMEWREHCKHSPWTVWSSTAMMVGAIAGAFITGFVADHFGRKPAVVGSMLLICLGNALLVLTGAFSQALALSLFFITGLACGGYMVTNMVLLIEILNHSATRLLVVSLNGWPFGMIGTAVLAYSSRNWRFFHLSISLLALFFFLIIQCFAFESIPWLIQKGRGRKAHLVKQSLHRINTFLTRNNDGSAGGSVSLNSKLDDCSNSCVLSSLDCDVSDGLLNTQGAITTTRTYTYLDLFRHRSICLRLLTLLFCFGSSSIISFGLYFSAEVLPGSRYVNIAMMGFGKLALGLLPFVLSNVMGRRPILLFSIGLGCFACWSLIAGWLAFDLSKHWLIAFLGLFITGVIDPNWKIIHLLSMELFPTPIRNMARALCNVLARLGSLSGPLVLLLRSYNELLPFLAFAVLLTIQFIISFFFLPETSGQPLPDQMPSTEDNGHREREDKEEEDDDEKYNRKRTVRQRSVSSQRSRHSVCSRAYSVDIPIL